MVINLVKRLVPFPPFCNFVLMQLVRLHMNGTHIGSTNVAIVRHFVEEIVELVVVATHLGRSFLAAPYSTRI